MMKAGNCLKECAARMQELVNALPRLGDNLKVICSRLGALAPPIGTPLLGGVLDLIGLCAPEP